MNSNNFRGTLLDNIPTDLLNIIDYQIKLIHTDNKIGRCFRSHRKFGFRSNTKCRICNFPAANDFGHSKCFYCLVCIINCKYVGCDKCEIFFRDNLTSSDIIPFHPMHDINNVDITHIFISTYTDNCYCCFNYDPAKCYRCEKKISKIRMSGKYVASKNHTSLDKDGVRIIRFTICEDCYHPDKDKKMNLGP